MALQSQSNKRLRRRRSQTARVVAPPVRTRRPDEFQFGKTEVLASIGIVIATVALVALVAIFESRAIETQRNEARAQIEATLSGQSVILADEMRREMLGVEQSLRILKSSFEADPTHFNMQAWKEQLPVLSDVTQDVFIADEHYVIQHDINPPSVGLGVGTRISGVLGGEVTTQSTRDETMKMGPTLQRLQTREHLSFLILRLDRPGGWVVGATYRTSLLANLYNQASLGLQGMTELINTRLGRVLVVAGPAASDPNYDIAKSPMYNEMQIRPDGTWVGPSAPDGVQRIHAFRRVPGRELAVVVAVNEAAAMQPSVAWAEGARSVAWGAALVILVAAALALRVVWTFRMSHRRQEALERERTILDSTQLELAEARGRLENRTGQLQALLTGIDEGVLALDSELRVAEWNQHFPALFGLGPTQLQAGLSLDQLLRAQAQAGEFGPLEDVEAEVARRMAVLRYRDGTHSTLYSGVANSLLAVSTIRLADGGLVLVVRPATAYDQIAAAAESAVQAQKPELEMPL